MKKELWFGAHKSMRQYWQAGKLLQIFRKAFIIYEIPLKYSYIIYYTFKYVGKRIFMEMLLIMN